MVEKELKKLKRQELLELLLDQSREASRLQEEYEEAESQIRMLHDSNERLSQKLEEKAAVMHKLQGRLDKKERKAGELRTEIHVWKFNRESELKEVGDLAEAVLRLNGLFKTAQQAADQYLYNIRQRCEGANKDTEQTPDAGEGLKVNGAEG